MSLKLQIDKDIKNAMLNKNQDELRTLRSIKSSILLLETKKGNKKEVSQEAELQLLQKAIKQRSDSIRVFKEQNREDLANKEIAEVEIIKKYLPEQLSKEKIEKELQAIINKIGASSIKDMGKVMGVASKKLAGKASNKDISELVKALLC